jgi:2-oxoglutarate ferredoxin oxidoreductase subunit beta
LKTAYRHPGAAFVEIFQNCIVFNEDVFDDFTARTNVADNQIQVQDGESLIYGIDGSNALAFDPDTLELKTIDRSAGDSASPLTHDVTNHNLAFALARLARPAFPVATGVLYDNPEPAYEAEVAGAGLAIRDDGKSLQDVMRSGFTWTVNETS